MSRIEQYKKAKSTADMVARSVERALGRDSPDNDKHLVTVAFSGLSIDGWDMKFCIHASYGYYGRSSGYLATSNELGFYLAAAIQKHASMLLDYAAKLAAQDAEKARQAAEDEAKAVLQTTAE